MSVHEQPISVCPKPVFIIGAPRSGTTILAWSLAQHSQFWTSGESYFLYDLFGANSKAQAAYQRAGAISSEGWLQRENVSITEYLEYLGLGVNALFTQRSQGRRWVEQTPHYALMADTLADMFPGALFLHVLRDGRKVVHSMQAFQNRLIGDRPASEVDGIFVPPWASDFRRACQTWRDYVNAAFGFCSRLPGRCLTVKLDSLVSNPREGFLKITEFLGAPSEESVPSYFQATRLNSSFSGSGAPKDPSRAWSPEQRRIFIGEAGSVMVNTGFASEDELCAAVDIEYVENIGKVKGVVQCVIPEETTVLITTKGDDRLLQVGRRRAWHFPRDLDGGYVGHHPADTSAAVENLEREIGAGAEYLVLPSYLYWWLDHYAGLSEHFQSHYTELRSDDCCKIWRLKKG